MSDSGRCGHTSWKVLDAVAANFSRTTHAQHELLLLNMLSIAPHIGHVCTTAARSCLRTTSNRSLKAHHDKPMVCNKIHCAEGDDSLGPLISLLFMAELNLTLSNMGEKLHDFNDDDDGDSGFLEVVRDI